MGEQGVPEQAAEGAPGGPPPGSSAAVEEVAHPGAVDNGGPPRPDGQGPADGQAPAEPAAADRPEQASPSGQPGPDAQPDQPDQAEVGGDRVVGSDGIAEPSATPTRRGAREMAKVIKERDEYLDQLRRTRADFENYRKRISRQQLENVERAAEGLIEKLLPVLDNFDLALQHGSGFEQVHGAFVSLLSQEGLVRIDPVDQPFDPTVADAVAHEEGDDGPVVAEVLRPGYKWKGRVLRPAMVRVRG